MRRLVLGAMVMWSVVAMSGPALAAVSLASSGHGRPWGRLLVIVPLSVALGAGVVALARLLRARGLIRD